MGRGKVGRTSRRRGVRGGPRCMGPVSTAAALCLYLDVNISYLRKAKELLKSIHFPLYF